MTQQQSHTIVFPYTDRSNASISVKVIDQPYGPESPTVLSIGSTLKGKPDDPSWVVHVPMDLIPSVAQAMMDAHEMEVKRTHLSATSTAAPGF